MTYQQLYEALGRALRQCPGARDETAFIAAKKGDGSYYDTDCEAVEVRVDAIGLIILTEGDQ